MRRIRNVILLGGLLGALAACDTIREEVGMTKQAPDEFTVVTKAPLTIPPKFTLRPPRPGAQRPQELQPREKARSALVGGTARRSGRDNAAAPERRVEVGTPKTLGESRLLARAGADKADPDIRQVVNNETSVLAEKDASIAERLLFWRDTLPPAQVVDAQKEAKRLREAQATGEQIDGGGTVVIERRKRGLLEDIF